MLSTATVDEVKRMIAMRNLSMRQIAKIAGISRGSVSAIANGSRRDYSQEERELDRGPLFEYGPIIRCAGCGGRVYSPCHLCRVRAIKSQERAAQRASPHLGFRPPALRVSTNGSQQPATQAFGSPQR
jgi:hypothetical protein